MKTFSLIFLCISLISCKFEKKPQGSFFEYVSESDTTCLKEISEAKKDLEKGKLTYCHYSGNIIHNYLRSEKELIEILKENKIDFRNQSSSCVVYENQTEHCYCELMQEKINEKYGEKFIDSLLNIADEKYLNKHINDTMYYESVIEDQIILMTKMIVRMNIVKYCRTKSIKLLFTQKVILKDQIMMFLHL